MSRIGIIPVDPVNLSPKGKLLSVFSCFTAILTIAWISKLVSLPPAYPLLVASMGASAVLVFIIPNSPLAQPWPLVGGQLVSAAVGVVCAQYLTDTALASAFAVGGSVLAMLLFRCLHPPGAATALAPVLGGQAVTSLGYGFVLVPVGLNVAVMLVLAIAINHWWNRHEYPAGITAAAVRTTNIQNNQAVSAFQTSISEQDVEQVLKHKDLFVDVSSKDLSKLLTDVQKYRFQQASGYITCADVMVRDVLTTEYGDEVEDAWKKMQYGKLKALPVIDKSGRAIGMITWHDFVKFISVDGNGSFQDKFRAFIRRTPDVSTKKPEYVGHIMSSPVSVLPENAPIVELITLMSHEGHRQIPIVNRDNRLVGMAYQDNLIGVLYNALEKFQG